MCVDAVFTGAGVSACLEGPGGGESGTPVSAEKFGGFRCHIFFFLFSFWLGFSTSASLLL